MNAKKAKALRKVLRNMVKGHPENIPVRDYEIVPKTSKTITVDKTDELGMITGIEEKVLFNGQVRLSSRSQRAVYHYLKKELEKNESK